MSWLSSQLKAAEHLFNAVDKTVMSAVETLAPERGGTDESGDPSTSNASQYQALGPGSQRVGLVPDPAAPPHSSGGGGPDAGFVYAASSSPFDEPQPLGPPPNIPPPPKSAPAPSIPPPTFLPTSTPPPSLIPALPASTSSLPPTFWSNASTSTTTSNAPSAAHKPLSTPAPSAAPAPGAHTPTEYQPVSIGSTVPAAASSSAALPPRAPSSAPAHQHQHHDAGAGGGPPTHSPSTHHSHAPSEAAGPSGAGEVQAGAPAHARTPSSGSSMGNLLGAATSLMTRQDSQGAGAGTQAAPAAATAAGSGPPLAGAGGGAGGGPQKAGPGGVPLSAPTPADEAALAALPPQLAGPPSSGAGASAREQQLAKLVDSLKERLRASKLENEELEDMLAKAEAKADSERALVGQLRGEVGALQEAKSLVEGLLHSQGKEQGAALREAQARAEAAQRQVLRLEAQVAALEESQRSLVQSKSDIEGGMLEALKAEVGSAEQRLEAEHRAHAAARSAAAAREAELEGLLASHASALAETQRAAEEAGTRARALEDALALAEAAHKAAQAQQQGGGPGGASPAKGEEAGGAVHRMQLELDSLRAEVERLRRGAQQAADARAAAEAAASAARDEAAVLRSEVEVLTSRKDVAALEVQLREASDMLFAKQAQIERLGADRAALQMRLEREVAAAREEAARSRQQAGASRGAGAGGATLVDVDMMMGGGGYGRDHVVPMDAALGEPYARLAARQDRVGKAVKAAAQLVDRTASTAAFVLRQYPLARLAVLGYLVLIHGYLYVMTATMQHAAVVAEEAPHRAAAKAAGGH